LPNGINTYLIDDNMLLFRKIIRALRTLLVGSLLAICVVIGVVPVLPERKGSFTIEIKVEEEENTEENEPTLKYKIRK
jgi:hypothetical protein